MKIRLFWLKVTFWVLNVPIGGVTDLGFPKIIRFISVTRPLFLKNLVFSPSLDIFLTKMLDFDPCFCTFCISIPGCFHSLCCQSSSLRCCCSIPSHPRRPWSGSEGSRRSRPCPPRFRIYWGKHKFTPSPPAPPTPSCHRLASSPPHWHKGLRRPNKFLLPLKYFIYNMHM